LGRVFAREAPAAGLLAARFPLVAVFCGPAQNFFFDREARFRILGVASVERKGMCLERHQEERTGLQKAGHKSSA